ncbi:MULTISPECIES: DUF31 family protein [unclassified Mycoplasma]|uniref:DUF31 family protein n=1 Tax=unclassified Mycoplasma TaxID=2683645 RepID=UPI00211C1C09|nr:MULTISPECIES: DUF31 family protein [unclassified Mycoplasma]UUM20133.1 DUF31 family protein [Mycoplasma sp. 1578d]UUM25113.1 DUF31 family protein [Mycoplasma sp. 3686d]
MVKIKKIMLVFSSFLPIGLIACNTNNSFQSQNTVLNSLKESQQDLGFRMPKTNYQNSTKNTKNDTITPRIKDKLTTNINPKDSNQASNSEPKKQERVELDPSNAPTGTKLKNNDQYIQSINNRTFLLRLYLEDNTQKEENGKSTVLKAGTVWLFDYAHEKNNKFKLFFATNYNTALNLFSEKDYQVYQQPQKLERYKPLKYSFSWTKDPYYDNFFGKHDNNLKIYENNFDNSQITLRNFYLAQDFMNQKAVPAEYGHYFANFAIIEMDLDLDTLSDNKDSSKSQEFKQKIISAITEVNESIERFEHPENQAIYLMNNKTIPYATLDYQTTNKIRDLSRESSGEKVNSLINTYLKDYEYSFKPDAIYSFGYNISPLIKRQQYQEEWVEIFNTLSNNIYYNDNYRWNKNENENKNILGRNPRDPELNFKVNDSWHLTSYDRETSYFNDWVDMKFYGNLVSVNLPHSSQKLSAGSLILNEQALPLGLIIDSSRNINGYDNYDQKGITLFQPFTQNIPTFQYRTQTTIQPYNLIDHTSNNLYQDQKISYRSRLNDVYGKDFKTAIFGGQLVNLK